MKIFLKYVTVTLTTIGVFILGFIGINQGKDRKIENLSSVSKAYADTAVTSINWGGTGSGCCGAGGSI